MGGVRRLPNFIDKKETAKLMSQKQINGGEKATLPASFSGLPDGGLHKYIESSSPVKPELQDSTESRQFKRWSGRSVKRNADGSLRMLYRQTREYFTAFDVGCEGAGAPDSEMPRGIFS